MSEIIKLFKFEEMEIEKAYDFEIGRDSRVSINNIGFDISVISKVRFIKHVSKKYKTNSLFIETYAGNIRISTLLVVKDYLIEINRGDYYIRKAEEFDYRFNEKMEGLKCQK